MTGRNVKGTARRKEALSWVLSHMPTDEFTTHDVMMQGDLLRNAVWPPYTKQAWKRITRSADSLGAYLSRHPEIEKGEGRENLERHGFRIRSQRWRRRQGQ